MLELYFIPFYYQLLTKFNIINLVNKKNMIDNNSLIGSSIKCQIGCHEQTRQQYKQKHEDKHYIYTKSELLKKIQKQINQVIPQDLINKKMVLLNSYFQNLIKKIQHIHQIKKKQLLNSRYQLAFSIIPDVKKYTISSYCKYISKLQSQNYYQLTCNNVDYLLRGLRKISSYDSSKIDNLNNFNKWLLQSNKQIQNDLIRLQKQYLYELEKIDQRLQQIKDEKEKSVVTKRHNQLKQDKKIVGSKILLVNQAIKEDVKDQFTVRITITKIITLIQSKTPKVLFIGRDSSGTAFFVLKNSQLIKQKNKIIIQKCRVDVHKGKKQITCQHLDTVYITNKQSNKKQKDLQSQNIKKQNRRKDERHNQRTGERGERTERTERGEGGERGERRVEITGDRRDVRRNRGANRGNYRTGEREVETTDDRRGARRDDRRDRRDQRDNRKTDQRINQKIQAEKFKIIENNQRSQTGRINRYQQCDQQKKFSHQESRQKNFQDQYEQQYTGKQQMQSSQQQIQSQAQQEDMGSNRRTQLQRIKIQKIDPGSQNMLLEVKIIRILDQIQNGFSCLIGDQTGTVNADLTSKEDCIVQGKSIKIIDCNSQIKKEHIVIVIGQNGRVTASSKKFDIINLNNNISQVQWLAQQ